MPRRVLALWTVVCVTWAVTSSLKLAAFNVQIFGQKKADNKVVMGYLAKIAVRYDIILIQEIRDNTRVINQTAIMKLIDRIKSDQNVNMALEISQREGRTVSKEQYAFLYRADLGVRVKSKYSDSPTWSESFERPPFIVRFSYPPGGMNSPEVNDVTLMGLHTKPTNTVAELQALPQVYNTVRNRWKTTNIIILGDLNADCHYVTKKQWQNIPIRHDNNFWWPIEEGVDTTVDSDCAYDRFIISGKTLRAAVIQNSPKPFNFRKQYNLSLQQALDVSDHYPIELEMRNRGKGRKPEALVWH